MQEMMANMQHTVSKAIFETPQVDMNKFREEVMTEFKQMMTEEFKKH